MKFLCLLLCFQLTLSCGKQASDAPSDNGIIDDIVPDDGKLLLEYAEQSSLLCDHSQCPEYVVKVLTRFRVDQEPTHCTGVMVDESTVLTSALCIPHFLTEQSSCSQDIALVFQKHLEIPAQSCSTIQFLSHISRNADPASWPRDFAFLKLAKPVEGIETLNYSLDGLNHQQKVGVWGLLKSGVDKESLVTFQKDCHVIHNSYVQPFAAHPSSPVFALSHCQGPEELAGGVVVDSNQVAKALYSVALDDTRQRMYEELLPVDSTKPVPQFSYIFNYNCIPGLDLNEDGSVNGRVRSGCNIDIRKSWLTTKRRAMISMDRSSDTFNDLAKRLQNRLANDDLYLRWSASFTPSGRNDGIVNAKLDPECFKNPTNWMHEFTSRNWFGWTTVADLGERSIQWPVFYLRIAFDNVLGVKGVVEEEVPLTLYRYNFSPRQVNREEHSFVTLYEGGDLRPINRYNRINVCPNHHN